MTTQPINQSTSQPVNQPTDCEAHAPFPIDDLTDIERLAISKVKLPKGTRDAVEPGKYLIDTTCRVRGTLTVGEDYEATSPPAADPWGLLALVWSKLNRQTQQAILRIHAEEDAEDRKRAVDMAKKKINGAMAEIVGPTKRPMKGKVTSTCCVHRFQGGR